MANMLRFTSLLAMSSGALALQSTWPKFAPRSPATLDHLFGSGLTPRQGCDGDSQECADGCIPLDAMCCDFTVGIYCESGETCTTDNTCCVEGLTCDDSSSDDSGDSGSSEDCADDETFCGYGCIPADAECCSESLGMYCDPGYTCDTETTCTDGSGSGGDDNSAEDDADDSSSSNDDDEDDSDSTGSSSSNSSGNNSGNSNNNNDDEDEEDAASMAKPGLLIIALGAALVLF